MKRKQYTVETGIERVGAIPRASGSIYAEMNVGDSIAHEKAYSARSAAKEANKRYEPKKFESGVDNTGVPRVWRLA